MALMKTHRARSGVSRRDFLTATVAAAATLTIVPRHVLGGPGQTPPSQRLNIAAIGSGGQGGGNIAQLHKLGTENIVALCDVDQRSAAGTFANFPKAKKHRDFRKMLDTHKDIDAVVVSTPDHVHAVASMAAIQRGKHVYCEKPLTHSICEARMVTEAARKAKVATQMGNAGHSGEGVRRTCEWVWAGVLGKIREAHVWSDRPVNWWPQPLERPKDTPPVPPELDWDLWLGPAPYRPYHSAYVPSKWRAWFDFGTGALGDMACHNMDSAFWALKLGHPISVQAETTEVFPETFPASSTIVYDFPARGDMPPVRLTWHDGLRKPPRPAELPQGEDLPSNGVLLIGEKGKLVDTGWASNSRLLPVSLMKEHESVPRTLPRSQGHHRDWVEACKGGKPASSNFDYAGPLTEMVLLGNLAIRTGKRLEWDGPAMKVTNVPEANQYVSREYRKGWSL